MPKEMKNESERLSCTEDSQEMDINRKLIFHMRDLNHIMRSLYEGKASQKRILIILNEVKSITQRDLTMRLGIQPGSASEILSKLENAGLILRTMSETDRRTANISLTEQGRQMAVEAAEQRNRRHEEMFSCLSEEEKEVLLTLLQKVNADWSRRYGAEAEERRQRHHAHKHGCEHDHGCGHGREHGGRGHDHDGEHGGHRHDHDGEHGGHRHDHDGEHGRHRHGHDSRYDEYGGDSGWDERHRGNADKS